MTSSAQAAANALGTLGAVCWSVQLIPQIWQNYKRQHTHGLQPTMMLLWASAGIPLGIYNITREFPIALQIQPQILTFLSLITWAQTQYYPPARDLRQRSIAWCVVVLTIACVLAGGVEAGIIFALRSATRHKPQADVEYYWPVVLMGALSALLLAGGVARHYVDIWKERTVRGISFLFVGIDAMGDLTSLVSVVCWWKAGRSLDILGLVVYGSELVLWMGVMVCGLWYNFRPWFKAKTKARHSQADPGVRTNEIFGASTSTRPGRPSSISSSISQASGTVFRTASGRTSQASSGHEYDDPRSHNLVRLRHLVQV